MNSTQAIKTTAREQHRGSDASDASNGHLMVDPPERRSSISFDKIRQISLSYSLQSEDAGDMVPLADTGGGGEQALLANGCSEIVVARDALGVVAGEAAGAVQSVGSAPRTEPPEANDVGRLIGRAGESDPSIGRASAANLAADRRHTSTGRNPFELFDGRQGGDGHRARDRAAAEQEVRLAKSANHGPQSHLSGINNNSAKNMGANMIVKGDNRPAPPRANERGPTFGPADINQEDEQFSSDNSSCWDCANGLPVRGQGTRVRAPAAVSPRQAAFDADYRWQRGASPAEVAGMICSYGSVNSNLNNRLDQLAAGANRRAHQERLVKHRGQPGGSRDSNARAAGPGGGGGLDGGSMRRPVSAGGGQQQEQTGARCQTTTNGPFADDQFAPDDLAGPFFDIVGDGQEETLARGGRFGGQQTDKGGRPNGRPRAQDQPANCQATPSRAAAGGAQMSPTDKHLHHHHHHHHHQVGHSTPERTYAQGRYNPGRPYAQLSTSEMGRSPQRALDQRRARVRRVAQSGSGPYDEPRRDSSLGRAVTGARRHLDLVGRAVEEWALEPADDHGGDDDGDIDWALTPRRRLRNRDASPRYSPQNDAAAMSWMAAADDVSSQPAPRRAAILSECRLCHSEAARQRMCHHCQQQTAPPRWAPQDDDQDEERLELELDENKQISIIIGTPQRRGRARRPMNGGGGGSASSTTTPRSRPMADDLYYRDYRRPSGRPTSYEPRYEGAGGRQRWPSLTSGSGYEPAERACGGPQRWPLGASDNYELVSGEPPEWDTATGARSKMTRSGRPQEMSRRSTISSSSDGAAACQDEAIAALLHSSARFQRRPTGPFEVSHHSAGSQQQQMPAKMRLQQQQQQQQQQQLQLQQQSSSADDQRKASEAPAAVSGPRQGPAEPAARAPPASEQINLDGAAQRTAPAVSQPSPPASQTAHSKSSPAQDQKPIKLRNLLTDEMTVDLLHTKNSSRSKGCSETFCLGAVINPVPVEHQVRTPGETWAQAKEFIDGYYASIKRTDTPAHRNRLKEIEEQVQSTDTYYLRETELIYGAKLAWRNAPRCIGRIQWSKLQVFDARFTRNANEMFEAICNHIKYATNKGNLRSAITIFPQRVKSTQNDWRVWNPQLIGYAGYRDKETGRVTGDPINVQITEICQKLGWQGRGGPFDILPVVLQANGGPPQLFKLPEELVVRVKIRHPKLDWFAQLNLEWYAVPAVSNMMLDVGGLQFTACPFNGWYMVTEVGARDLGDANRYNMLEPIAQRMGLNTTTNMSLWRDQALTQLNLAVLHSYQQSGVTIVDHHTACETFMTHLKNEQRLRGGCPADWVWLVPPAAGSSTQVFHQEMVNYHLLPNYEYLQPAWKNFDWARWERVKSEQGAKPSLFAGAGGGGGAGDGPDASKLSLISTIKASTSSLSPLSKLRIGINQAAVGAGASPANSMGSPGSQVELTPRHLRFKEIARAVKFTSKLFGKALSRRIKATILYATETGKSERFANKLAQTFSHAFNVHLMSMSDYDMTCLEHEALLLIVTSTFGNGDPPENGELFAKHLAAIKMTGDSSPDIDSINSVSTNPFFQMLSEDHKDGLSQAAAAAAAAAAVAAAAHSTSGNMNLGPGASLATVANNAGGSLGDSSQFASSGDSSLTSGQQRELDNDSDEADTSSGSIPSLSFGGAQSAGGGLIKRDDNDTPAISASDRKQRAAAAVSASAAAATGATMMTTTPPSPTSALARQEESICQLNQEQQTNIRPLSNVRFAVFALGSTAYPHFCAFGRYVDQTLGELGAERILKCCCGDELSGQEKALTEWSNEVFRVACDVFCLTDTMEPIDDRPEAIWTPKDVRFEYVDEHDAGEGAVDSGAAGGANDVERAGPAAAHTMNSRPASKSSIIQNLAGIAGKKILPFTVKRRTDLHEFIPDEGLQTICVDLDGGLKPVRFQPGDHIGIYPVNKFEVVDKILKRIEHDLELSAGAASAALPKTPPGHSHNMDKKVSILIKRGKMDPLMQGDDWIQFDTLPIVSIREALTRYLDITNPPNQDFLSILARQASDSEDKKRLQQMARNFNIYEAWKNKQAPSLLSTLEEFKSVRFDPALITQIPSLKPRFYSVSGTSVTLTLGVVRYKTASGQPREGLCSNYLNTVPIDPKSYVFGYVRSAPAFHMPQDKSIPMLLISAGTGIAPFRSFWQQRFADIKSAEQARFGRMEFYFGCRNSRYILFKDELDDMHGKNVLSSINIAFSRPLDRDVIEETSAQSTASSLGNNTTSKIDSIRQARKRMYVQDKLLENHKLVFKTVVCDGAHIYVCGDVAMADGVYKTLAKIININIKANNKLAKQSTGGADLKSPNKALGSCTVTRGGKTTSVDLIKSGEDGETVLMNLRNLNRYHEDIFGAKQV